MNLALLTDRLAVARTADNETFLTLEPPRVPAPARAVARPRLICHWHRDEERQLACHWERDVPPDSHDRSAAEPSATPSVRHAA
jgi:hypothetical protein